MREIKCPACGAKSAVKIVYGLPTYDAFLDEQAGKIKLGGCVIDRDSPKYFCKKCKHEWGRINVSKQVDLE
jgi:hypothetical protein